MILDPLSQLSLERAVRLAWRLHRKAGKIMYLINWEAISALYRLFSLIRQYLNQIGPKFVEPSR